MEVAFLHFITFKTNRREASRSCNGRPKYLKYFFQHNWKEIDGTYNYLVGLDCNYRDAELSRLENSLPKIIHFAGIHKPWYTYSSTRLRELWWTYRDLDWFEVLSKYPNLNYYKRVNQSKKNTFLF